MFSLMSVGLTQLSEDVNRKRLESDGTLPRWLEVGRWCFLLPSLWAGGPSLPPAGLGTTQPPSLRKPSPFTKAASALPALSRGGGALVAKSCPTLAAAWTEEPDRLQSMGFSKQECWSGLPFPSPSLSPENPNTLQKAENRTISPQCLQ